LSIAQVKNNPLTVTNF